MLCLCVAATTAYPQGILEKADKGVIVTRPINKTKKTASNKPAQPRPKTVRQKPKQDPDARYASKAYMEITGMSFANTDYMGNIIDDYGAKLYTEDLRYLSPKIFYQGLASEEKDVTLYFKVIKENWEVDQSPNSPDGYSFSRDVTVSPGVGQSLSLGGWGARGGSSFNPGQYTVEVWHKGNKLYEKSVRVNPGSAPVVTSKLLTVSGIMFGSSCDGKMNIDYGGTLYEDDVKYLKPKISYTGHAGYRNVTLYERIFTPAGSLLCNSTSPKGFTRKIVATVSASDNALTLDGYGSAKGGIYPVGEGKYELWLDGDKIYQTTFNVVKKGGGSPGGTPSGKATYLTVEGKTALTVNFGPAGGTIELFLNTDAGTWETWGVPKWCELVGKTARSFTIKCAPNTTGIARTDYMKVKAGGKEVRIDFEQESY